MPVYDGSDIRLHFLWEDNGYDSSPNDSTPKSVGKNGVMETLEATRNGTRVFLPASRIAVDIKSTRVEGSWAINAAVSTPWVFGLIKGRPGSPTDNGDGTFTYTFDGEPQSAQLLVGYEGIGDERALGGAVPLRAVIDTSVDEDTAVLTMEGIYASDSKDTPASLTSQPDSGFDALDFSDARLDLDGTTQTIMQDASLTLEYPDLGGVVGFGSRFFVDYGIGAFEPTIEYSKLKEDNTPTENIYGSSTTSMQEDLSSSPPLTQELDNGQSGGDMNRLTFKGTGSFSDTLGEPNLGDPSQRVQEDINKMLQDVTIEARNGVSTAP
jgi:hypothetical protein